MAQTPFSRRIAAAQRALEECGAGALLVGPSADLRYLAGYDALPLERLTLLLVPAHGEPALVVPALERPRAEVSPAPEVARVVSWEETDDPFALVRALAPPDPAKVLLSDRLWASFVLRIQAGMPGARFGLASEVLRALRARKDPEEVAALRRAAAVVDGIVRSLREERASGSTERAVARWLAERMLDAGCERALFTIVASGPNAASPHHEPGEREITSGDALVCDFGGLLGGYCSDITRTFAVGQVDPALAEAYEVVAAAQEAGVRAAAPGVPAQDVDRAARKVIADAGYGRLFVHRTGHGIGLEEHEDPYLVEGNGELLEAGMTFSVEPGIYAPGRFGVRLEDIVVLTEGGAERLNEAPRDLAVLVSASG